MSMGGGGGGGQAPSKLYFRNISKEAPTVSNWIERMTQTDYPAFYQSDPVFSSLYKNAAAYANSGPSQLLQQLQGGAQGLQQWGMNQLQAGPSQLTQALGQFGMNELQGGPSQILQTMQQQSLQDLQNRGALDPAQNRDVRNATLATAGAMGMGNTPGTLGQDLLNREQYRQQRQLQAEQYASGTEQLSQADLAQRFGFANTAQTAAEQDAAARMALASGGQSALGQAQQLTDADIAQKFQIPLQVAQGTAQTFQGFSNPILQYLGQAFTPTVYGGGTQSDSMSGIGSLIGTVITAAATAY